MERRNLITIDDLSCGEVMGLFKLADEMSAAMSDQYGLLRGKVMASLFFEPSTRTRLSFETAMHRLGGAVISVADPKSTSLAKGESLADTARVIGSYADIIVMRHPWEGAAKIVADYAGIPVINGGDGGHQHPTQTLCDLYTLQKERGAIQGLKIALLGDLKYGRTIHSLIFALAKFGANIIFCPSPGLEVPEHVLNKLVTEYGGTIEKRQAQSGSSDEYELPLDAVYTQPSNPHQLTMMPDANIKLELKGGVDALYVTRPQKERFTAEDGQSAGKSYVVDKKMLRDKSFSKTLVMHPLPRVDELAYEMDTDPRAMYFAQAARGVPVRMALLAYLLEAKQISETCQADTALPEVDYPLYSYESGIRCPNPKCVSVQESEAKYIRHEFKIVNREPLTLRCAYCEHGFEPKYVASKEWHEGKIESKRYHRANSHWAKDIKPENLIIFESAEKAEAAGFKPGHTVEAQK